MQPRRSAVAPSSVVNYLTNPGASGTAVLYDDCNPTAGKVSPDWSTAAHYVEVAMYVDQPVTISHKWAAPGSTTLRSLNDDSSLVAVAPGIYFEKRFRLRAGRNVISVSTGTACQTWEVGVQVDEFGGIIPSDLAVLIPQ